MKILRAERKKKVCFGSGPKQLNNHKTIWINYIGMFRIILTIDLLSCLTRKLTIVF